MWSAQYGFSPGSRFALKKDSQLEQWDDYQAGIIFGWKLSKTIGIFAEGEYTKFWDSEIYNSSVGVNFTFR